MVTKEDVEKAEAEWDAAVDDAIAADDAADAAFAALDKYIKLKVEFENENGN